MVDSLCTVVTAVRLSALLMIGRRTTVAGVRLHLDDRPAYLDRILELTGTLDYLTTPVPSGAAKPSVTEDMAARPTVPDPPT
ncbi:hypothetical protein [Streptomyces globisporus]|uniref:hypothetical protein n=1 Tax=Streptomyces globisporus TaxID=1908 RepID=UPI0037B16917